MHNINNNTIQGRLSEIQKLYFRYETLNYGIGRMINIMFKKIQAKL